MRPLASSVRGATASSRYARARGFTLIELMVSLVAGLLIAIAVVALAKASTQSFHEQARIMTVEQTLRSASERLRNDLTRTSFMGTGNAFLSCFDSNCSAGGAGVPLGQRSAYIPGTSPLRYAGMNDLQGIRVEVQGSLAATNVDNHSGANGLAPDSLRLAGNMTTDDSYIGRVVGIGACGGPRIQLNALEDPSVGRLLNGAPTDIIATQYVRNAFTPVAATRFFARVVDVRGCQHFVHVQDAVATTTTATIDVCADATGNSIISTQPVAQNGTGSATCGWGGPMEQVTISPLHRVRWYLAPTNVARLLPLANVPGVDDANAQFMLFRELLDATGAPLPAPPAGPAPQIVAEYAVDLKFGIVVDDPALVAPNNIRVFDLDTDPANITLWTRPANATTYNAAGPQRVRSVRYRISTRAALADRKGPIPNAAFAPYILRYCMRPGNCGINDNFARVRTLVSEVNLLNQARMAY